MPKSVHISVKKGKLPGYHILDPKKTRRIVLNKIVKKDTLGKVIKRVNALYVFNKNNYPNLAKKFKKDVLYLQKFKSLIKKSNKRSPKKSNKYYKMSGGNKFEKISKIKSILHKPSKSNAFNKYSRDHEETVFGRPSKIKSILHKPSKSNAFNKYSRDHEETVFGRPSKIKSILHKLSKSNAFNKYMEGGFDYGKLLTATNTIAKSSVGKQLINAGKDIAKNSVSATAQHFANKTGIKVDISDLHKAIDNYKV